MLRAKLWNESVPRVELDERAREARLRLERIERQLLPRAAVTRPLFSGGVYPGASRESRTRWPLSNRRPSRQFMTVWVEECGSFCRASNLSLCHPSG
jgi:hypothetical protein